MVFSCQCWPMQDAISAQPNTLRVFTLSELKKATKNFDPSSKIGESVHMGIVSSVEHPFNDIRVVVKRVEKGLRVWESDVKFLGKIKHQNLVKLIGYHKEVTGRQSNWLLVYEYMPNRSLDGHLSSLPWGMRLIIAKDAATGLAYLHEELGRRQIIFKDFKPSNILLNNQMNAKLSYFGFAREGPQPGQTHVAPSVVGTKGYTAPEYVETGRLTCKMDVWSYGIFLEELITGGQPLAQENSENNPECMRFICCYAGAGQSNLVVDLMLEGKHSEKSMQKLASIANKCLAVNPKLRPKMSEVLKMVKEAIKLEKLNPDLTIQVC